MSTILQLDQMSTSEKMLAMEALWSDLCDNAEAQQLPSWHREILNSRKKAVEEGREKILDWQDAKRMIREQTQ